MTGSYRLSPQAKEDLRRLWRYGLENWGQAKADQYHQAFFKHFEQITAHPFMYPASEIREGYRRSGCGKDCVYYRVCGSTVEIMAIIGRQNLKDQD